MADAFRRQIQQRGDAFHVISYAWHNRMYVAVTRARYAVAMYGEMSRGTSSLLQPSVSFGFLEHNGPNIEGL